MTNLTYDQLRRIVALVHDNTVLKAKLDEFIAGKLTTITESDLLGIVAKSNVDKDMIRILTGLNPDEMDAIDGLEAITSFFDYIRVNKQRLSSWLASIGYQVQKNSPKKAGKSLK